MNVLQTGWVGGLAQGREMPAEATTAPRYHRLAQECLDAAAAFLDGDKRDALLEMA